MINVTLKQFRYFEALARHGHFGRAADTCAISQPALSMQIKELEETLGAQLFERSARQVRLTGFGEDFAVRVRDILRGVDELEDLARTSGEQMSGRLRIGVIPTIAPYVLPRILGQLGQTNPELDIHVRETLTPRLVQELLDGRIDTAIVALPIVEPTLTEVPLFTENFVLVRPVADQTKPIPLIEELQTMRLLLLEEGHCLRDQALSFCDMPTARPREGLDGSSLSTLVQLVGAGIGVTLIPEMAVDVETRSAPVCINHFVAPEPERTIGMIWRKTNPLATQLHHIANEVQIAAKSTQKMSALI